MSSSDTNPMIPLEANTLYIATSQLMAQPGKFHWAFFLMDAIGTATKHHWAEIVGGGDYAEAYQARVVNPVRTYSTNFVATFAYLKVRGFVFPSEEFFAEVARNAFPEDRRLGFKTVKENRWAGLTCRTWVLSILSHYKKLNYLKRDETMEWFEEQVTKISAEMEERGMNEGGLRKSFFGEI